MVKRGFRLLESVIFRPVLKGSIFNSAVDGNTDIFDDDLTQTYTPSTFRIYVCFDKSGVLSVRRTKAGTTVSEQLNSGSALVANCAYMFDIIIESGETINLQYSVTAKALSLKVLEIPAVIS